MSKATELIEKYKVDEGGLFDLERDARKIISKAQKKALDSTNMLKSGEVWVANAYQGVLDAADEDKFDKASLAMLVDALNSIKSNIPKVIKDIQAFSKVLPSK